MPTQSSDDAAWLEERDLGSDLTRAEIMELFGFDPSKRYVVRLADRWSDIAFLHEQGVVQLREKGEPQGTYYLSPEDLRVRNEPKLYGAVFSSLSDQYRTISSAFSIAQRVAESLGHAISLKDFLTLVTLLEKEVALKQAAVHVPGHGTVTETERRTMFAELKRLRYQILERIYEVRHAREDFDHAMERLGEGDDIHFSAELQRTNLMRMERAERELEQVIKEYNKMDETLFTQEGAFIMDPAGEDIVVEVYRMPEKVPEQKDVPPPKPVQNTPVPTMERHRPLSLEAKPPA